jgi:DNA-binding GntR family transcriptional regulator
MIGTVREKLESYLTQAGGNDSSTDGRLRRDVAYERIKDALQHADLEPGDVLSEVQLSRLLGISRTPIREALQQLEKEGLVQMIPGRAVTVASRSAKDVLDVLHIRMMLEPEAVRLAAECATPQQIDRLQTAIHQMEEAVRAGNYPAWAAADAVFHETLQHACPNPLLGETIVQMRDRVHHIANTDFKGNMPRLQACTAEHRQIVDAIAARDAHAAESAMRSHLNALRDSLLRRWTYG